MGLFILIIVLLTPFHAAKAETVRLGERSYDIALPADSRGAPLILALHGGGGNPGQFARASGFGAAATAKGYAVAFPAGSVGWGNRLLTWNAGYCCGYAARAGVDDDAFLRAVAADAADRFGLDSQRIYVTGMSNGAMMAESFAARNPDLVRALAAVAGTMDTGSLTPQGPVPLLVIHGTADENVPYGGGTGTRTISGTDYASVPSVVAAFLSPWGKGLTQSTSRIDRHNDGTSITVTDHVRSGTVVLRLITVEGGGHHWPGGPPAWLDRGETQEIDANDEILRFFALHGGAG